MTSIHVNKADAFRREKRIAGLLKLATFRRILRYIDANQSVVPVAISELLLLYHLAVHSQLIGLSLRNQVLPSQVNFGDNFRVVPIGVRVHWIIASEASTQRCRIFLVIATVASWIHTNLFYQVTQSRNHLWIVEGKVVELPDICT